MPDAIVTKNEDSSRYEIAVEDELVGYASYEVSDNNQIAFTSTHVGPQFRNQGLAAQLARRALDDARGANLKVIPQCSYFVVFMKRHSEYADLLA